MVALLLDHGVGKGADDRIDRADHPSLLREMCLHHLSSGGKGFRSGLWLTLYQSLDADPQDSLPQRLA